MFYENPQRHYTLVCSACRRQLADDGLSLRCPEDHPPAFLRTEYQDTDLAICPGSEGLYRYRRWLPVVRTVPGAGGTVVYRSDGLGHALGLRDLWIAFNGYWPERGAFLRTATFKELEAYTVWGRLPEQPPILVVPSAGNTAAAFASVFSRAGVRCLLIVPQRGMYRFAGVEEMPPGLRLVSVTGSYDDAIDLADRVSALPGFQAVGGAWNVARRDGLATVMLSAAEAMGRLPDFYFQAVGSAVGAIAVHEAATRLITSGGYGTTPPRLMICQNKEFAPIHELWRPNPGRRGFLADAARRRASGRVHADELINQRAPYFVQGGIDNVLSESRGEVLVSDSASARAATGLFSSAEGIDIEPAASVAVSCLREAVVQGRIPAGASVLLNITGGGRARLSRMPGSDGIEPALRLNARELRSADAPSRIRDLFSQTYASALPIDNQPTSVS